MAGISKKTPLPHWKKVMEQAGWETAAEMARDLNLPNSTAHCIVYGERNPKADLVYKIAKAARTDPSILLADILKYANKHATT